MIEMFSDHFMTYQKIKYSIGVFLLLSLSVFGLFPNKTLIIFAIIALIFMYFINQYLIKHDNTINPNIIIAVRFIELSLYNLFDYLFSMNDILRSMWSILILSAGLSFIVDSSELEKTTIFSRKLFYFAPIIVKTLFSISKKSEAEWFSYCLLQALISIIIFYIVDAYLHLNSTYDSIKRKLTIEKSNIESNNEKLLDYQERVKSINEQINYQKIELARTLRDLEQVNIEIESQTSILKYMASTFDILKCMNVITDSIIEVKKPKLCAFYVDKDTYMNKESRCIIKTNYTSMERRLRKDIESIFNSISQEKISNCKIIRSYKLKDYKFIGDANINSMALMPLSDGDNIYGLMIVGSDEDGFFDRGTSYYENCIIEFGSAIKSTILYLQMEDMARKDGLTGIYNRVYNTELFKSVSKEALNNKTPLTVALFDIDKFKNVNDTYGHLAGDDVIKMVANVAQSYAEKHNGFACRFGGEEFLLTLPNIDEVEAMKILESMHNEIKSTTVKSGNYNISVNVCIGVSSYPNICKDPEILVSRADNAMYYGKKHGRGRLVLDNPELDLE